MKQADQSSISTLALAGVGLFVLAVFGALGGLLYKSRARNMPPAPVVVAQAQSKPLAKTSTAMEDGDAVPLRIVSRSPAKEESAEPAAPVVAESNPLESIKPQEVASAAPVEVASNESGLKVFTPTEVPAAAKAEMSDELIPEIKGQSYTTKKMLSNGLDPNNLAKPDGKTPAKKPDVKKPVVPPKTPVVPPPVQPPKPPVAKPDASKQPSALPPLPATGDGKVDVTKAPIYVLNDGRRIRALIVREADGMVSIRNEVGTQINFKKSDVKEVLRN